MKRFPNPYRFKFNSVIPEWHNFRLLEKEGVFSKYLVFLIMITPNCKEEEQASRQEEGRYASQETRS